MSTSKASQEKKKYEKEKKKKDWKIKRKRQKRSKKNIVKGSSKREHNKDSLMRKKIEKRYIIQKAHGNDLGWLQ